MIFQHDQSSTWKWFFSYLEIIADVSNYAGEIVNNQKRIEANSKAISKNEATICEQTTNTTINQANIKRNDLKIQNITGEYPFSN